MDMRIPEWVKPAAWGVVVGAAAFAVVGFSTDWIVTGADATERAAAQSEKAVLAALTPVCVAQFGREPTTSQTDHLAALGAEDSWRQSDYVEAQGWATMPGTEAANADVAETCADELLKVAGN